HDPLSRPGARWHVDLELTRSPAGVADEDPQAVHGLVAGQQLEQQFPVRAEVDALKSLDRMLGGLDGAKKEPHRAEFNRPAEVNLVVQLREGLEIRKKARGWKQGGTGECESYRGRSRDMHDR